jgi:hypothetical protein
MPDGILVFALVNSLPGQLPLLGFLNEPLLSEAQTHRIVGEAVLVARPREYGGGLGAQIYWISLAVGLKRCSQAPRRGKGRGHNGAAWLSSVVEASRGLAPDRGNRTTKVAP